MRPRAFCRLICRIRLFYSKVNPADAPVLTLSLTSDVLPLTKVEDLADTRLAQKISQISGVGLVTISGGQRPAVRVQTDTGALNALGMSIDDVRTALGSANVDLAKGSLDGKVPVVLDRRERPAAIGRQTIRDLIIAYRQGATGFGWRRSPNPSTAPRICNRRRGPNSTPSIVLNIQRQPGGQRDRCGR
ncbi:efflux RND transporter permease subunit [Paraburkholderia sp. BL6669N2]|uniref:efflux RND transporter permease subunit n=1 Tax=Paraburkholderia sp. BL6669N2 TaxID=1938807 RepID=UPI0021624306|nr:efflux RND transporter permease subunit [Paraburkholderia sp. BL6669N2]